MSQAPRAEKKPVTVLLVEEHESNDLSSHILLGEYSRVLIVGIARTYREAVAATAQFQPDVIIMDFQFDNGTGIEVCQEVLSHCQGGKVLFLTNCEDSESVIEAMKAGASGYLEKNIEPPCLIQAIELIVSGKLFITSGVLRVIQQLLRGRGEDWSNGYLSMEQRRVLGLVNHRQEEGLYP